MQYLVALVKDDDLEELARSLEGKGFKVTVVPRRVGETDESSLRDKLLVTVEKAEALANIEDTIKSSGHEAATFTMGVEERPNPK